MGILGFIVLGVSLALAHESKNLLKEIDLYVEKFHHERSPVKWKSH